MWGQRHRVQCPGRAERLPSAGSGGHSAGRGAAEGAMAVGWWHPEGGKGWPHHWPTSPKRKSELVAEIEAATPADVTQTGDASAREGGIRGIEAERARSCRLARAESPLGCTGWAGVLEIRAGDEIWARQGGCAMEGLRAKRSPALAQQSSCLSNKKNRPALDWRRIFGAHLGCPTDAICRPING